MESLINRLTFKLKPYAWQFEAMKRAEQLDSFAFLAEVGSGKTGAMINTLRLRYGHARKILRTVIVSPLITLYNWQDEFKKHSTIDESLVIPLVKSSTRLKQFKKLKESKESFIVIINYESLLNDEFYSELVKWKPEIIVLDEMHYIKNPKSKRTKKICKLAKNIYYRYGMTGTPLLNTPLDIFSQWLYLDLGTSFGTSLVRFRSRYFHDVNSAWSHSDKHFPKYEIIPQLEKEFHDKIYERAVRVTKEDCLDLPPLIKKKIAVPLSPEQQKYYDQMERDFITFINDDHNEAQAVVAQIALTKALRLQQIVCGYVATENGEEINLTDVPRLTILKELLETITKENKVIVWCSFANNYKQIGRICEELGLKHGFITGSMSLDEKKKTMDDLKHDDDFKVVIANRRAGGIGINLIEAKYAITFSRNFSLGEEIQSEARNYRGGSEIHDKVIKIDLCAPNTVDEMALQALQDKQDVSDRIIDMYKEKKK